jgi:dCMP deaminase
MTVNNEYNRWDVRFIKLAKHVSEWSKDPSTKVGAVIVDLNRRVVSTGYNGFPRVVDDHISRYNNREEKLEIIIHGEINAILFAQRSLQYCTLYTFPFMPCSRCASIVIQSGISRVCSVISDSPRWRKSFELSEKLFKEAGVEVKLYDIGIL